MHEHVCLDIDCCLLPIECYVLSLGLIYCAGLNADVALSWRPTARALQHNISALCPAGKYAMTSQPDMQDVACILTSHGAKSCRFASI